LGLRRVPGGILYRISDRVDTGLAGIYRVVDDDAVGQVTILQVTRRCSRIVVGLANGRGGACIAVQRNHRAVGRSGHGDRELLVTCCAQAICGDDLDRMASHFSAG
jgi:hypothetical protein